jgi:hypothetical protein
MGNQSRDRTAKLDLLIIPQPIAEKNMREWLSNLLECLEGRRVNPTKAPDTERDNDLR